MGKNKPGRPPGSRTKVRDAVLCYPAVCPTCQRTVAVNLKTVPDRVLEHAGTLPDGTPYNRMEWRHVTCECGQALSVRTPIFKPEESDE